MTTDSFSFYSPVGTVDFADDIAPAKRNALVSNVSRVMAQMDSSLTRIALPPLAIGMMMYALIEYAI